MAEQPHHTLTTAADMDGVLVEKALIVYREQIAKNRDALDRRLRLIDTNLAALRKSREGEQIVLEELPDAGHWEIVDPRNPEGAGIAVDFRIAKENLPPATAAPSSVTRKTDVPKTKTAPPVTPDDLTRILRTENTPLSVGEIVRLFVTWKGGTAQQVYHKIFWHLSRGRERRRFVKTAQGWTLAEQATKRQSATKKARASA